MEQLLQAGSLYLQWEFKEITSRYLQVTILVTMSSSQKFREFLELLQERLVFAWKTCFPGGISRTEPSHRAMTCQDDEALQRWLQENFQHFDDWVAGERWQGKQKFLAGGNLDFFLVLLSVLLIS